MKKDPLDELKTSPLDRRLSIAKASLNIGGRWAANTARGLFQSKTQKQHNNKAFAKEQAQYLVNELGKLKGSVVKIGQMLALYGDSFLPKEIVDALHTLDDKTAPLSWQTIYRTLYNELGDTVNTLTIDPTPIGTASLAQVHKASISPTANVNGSTIPNNATPKNITSSNTAPNNEILGDDIVLKIQYPNIAGAIDSDLALFKQLLKLTNIVPQTRSLDDWFGEIQTLLYNEVDYAKEADTTERFFARLGDDNRYIVPKIYRQYCTKQLLAMSYEAGVSLNDPILTTLSQARRNKLGQAALDIIIKEIFVWGEMQTDPNFGNYLVRLDTNNHTNDQLVLLDFGAVKTFEPKLITIAQNLLKAGYHQDKQAMLQAMSGYAFFDTMNNAVKSDMAEVFLLATEPFADPKKLGNSPYLDYNGHYLWASSDLYNRVTAKAGNSMKSIEFSLPPKEMMFISRKFIGAYALLSMLDARTDSQALIGAYL